jgi:hypothetical protein
MSLSESPATKTGGLLFSEEMVAFPRRCGAASARARAKTPCR